MSSPAESPTSCSNFTLRFASLKFGTLGPDSEFGAPSPNSSVFRFLRQAENYKNPVKGFYTFLVLSSGIEPESYVPQTYILSIELGEETTWDAIQFPRTRTRYSRRFFSHHSSQTRRSLYACPDIQRKFKVHARRVVARMISIIWIS